MQTQAHRPQEKFFVDRLEGTFCLWLASLTWQNSRWVSLLEHTLAALPSTIAMRPSEEHSLCRYHDRES